MLGTRPRLTASVRLRAQRAVDYFLHGSSVNSPYGLWFVPSGASQTGKHAAFLPRYFLLALVSSFVFYGQKHTVVVFVGVLVVVFGEKGVAALVVRVG